MNQQEETLSLLHTKITQLEQHQLAIIIESTETCSKVGVLQRTCDTLVTQMVGV